MSKQTTSPTWPELVGFMAYKGRQRHGNSLASLGRDPNADLWKLAEKHWPGLTLREAIALGADYHARGHEPPSLDYTLANLLRVMLSAEHMTDLQLRRWVAAAVGCILAREDPILDINVATLDGPFAAWAEVGGKMERAVADLDTAGRRAGWICSQARHEYKTREIFVDSAYAALAKAQEASDGDAERVARSDLALAKTLRAQVGVHYMEAQCEVGLVNALRQIADDVNGGFTASHIAQRALTAALDRAYGLPGTEPPSVLGGGHKAIQECWRRNQADMAYQLAKWLLYVLDRKEG